MIVVPPEFAEWRTRVDGEAGREWVATLPALVDRLCAEWDLAIDDAPPLHDVGLWEAAEVAGTLVRRLAVPAPPGLRPLSEIADGMVEHLQPRQRALGDPVPSAWLEAVRRLLRTIVDAGDLDADAAHGWTVARCVDYWLWGLENGLTIDPVRCERVLAALVS